MRSRSSRWRPSTRSSAACSPSAEVTIERPVSAIARNCDMSEPSAEEIAADLELPLAKVLETIIYRSDVVSTDLLLNEEGKTSLGELLEDLQAENPEDRFFSAALSEALQEALAALSERERTVLQMLFGMYDDHNYTLEEAGRALNLSPERIRQIESKALRILRHPKHSRKLRDAYQ